MSEFLKGKTGLVYAGAIGLVLSDVIPTLGDALYFYRSQKDKEAFIKNEITSKQYWARELAGYYLYNSAWWALVFLIVYNVKGDWETKLKVMAGLAGFGAVAAVIIKNLQKDKTLSAALYKQKTGESPIDIDAIIKANKKLSEVPQAA